MKNNKPLILIGYRDKSISLYKPKRNKLKVGLLIGLVVTCLITPFTNWFLLVAFKVLNKFPLWVYK